MTRDLYSSAAWHALCARVRARDADRCTISRLIGGDCSRVLHVHHLIPVSEGGAPLDEDNCVTTCARHHPMLEAMRRYVLRKRTPIRCSHHHPYPHGRVECERRLARTG